MIYTDPTGHSIAPNVSDPNIDPPVTDVPDIDPLGDDGYDSYNTSKDNNSKAFIASGFLNLFGKDYDEAVKGDGKGGGVEIKQFEFTI